MSRSIETDSSSESFTYAPVLIPTLCRYNHLKACLDSLGACTGAEKTHVYVALDYPAKESHIEGWEKCKEYLTRLEDNHPFKELTVIRRDRNLGLGFNGNHWDLVRLVLKTYDRFIFSEDDNLFAPAFLQFINKGLELFKNDPTIVGINGYRHFYNLQFEDNSYFLQNIDFSAWGFGMWKDRFKMIENQIGAAYLRKKALNPITWIRIGGNGFNRLKQFLHGLYTGMSLTDNAISINMGINSLNVVMPIVSMVRNMGWDNSGEHCNDDNGNIAQMHTNQIISNDKDFEFCGNGKAYYKENHDTYVRESYGKISFSEFLKQSTSKIFKKIFK
ncbi:MAG: glycosyl transferase [Muribaculaceae bacterium]|nr:glycosyl transferase [Muribaculaceae bacterium]